MERGHSMPAKTSTIAFFPLSELSVTVLPESSGSVKSGAVSSSGRAARESAARARRARLLMAMSPPVGFASSDRYLTRFVWRDPTRKQRDPPHSREHFVTHD